MANPDDHELCRFDRGDTHLDDELTSVDHLLRIVFCVHLHIEGLGSGCPKERSIPPDPGEKGGDIALDPAPEVWRVWLKDNPLRPIVDGLFDEKEEAAEIDIFPLDRKSVV